MLPLSAGESATLDGGQIYQSLCQECHGDKGQGVAGKYDEPLWGERTLDSLARYIDRTMPEEAPEKCSAEQSVEVAKYIYDAFYSPAARDRINPPKRDFSRLTNRQFQESVADLFASFSEPLTSGAPTGLTAKYFESNGMNKKAKKVVERLDARLAFDFGEGSPDPGIKAEQFSIAWQGSLLVTHTGWHEFKLATPNGARLYLNGELSKGDKNERDDSGAKRQSTFIDSWVSAKNEMRETTARIFLLGGRAYPIRLDYFKFKEKLGSVRLEWKPPHGVWAVLGAPWLSPESAPHVTIVSTTFPADDGSVGYERGTAVSKGWHEATTKAAVEVAAAAMSRISVLTHISDDDPDRPARMKQFIHTFAERAFRRPLTDDLKKLYVERAFASGVEVDLAVKRAIMLILKSPRFVYPEDGRNHDEFVVASRLALTLWDSLPDATLLEAAKSGALNTLEQIQAQALRMMALPQAKAKMNSFFEHWLHLEEADDLSKDAQAYPGFDESFVADLRRSLETFVDRVVWSENSNYRELLEADYIYLNEKLAAFYGMPKPEGDFVPVKFDAAQRSGILTHPFLLAAFSYHKSSSPIHRGVFLTRYVMGRFLKPPPMAIEFMDNRFDPSLTMREKVTELTSKESCMGCHITINPLGFSLEHYDAAGRFRTTDNNKPVNSVSDYIAPDGEVIKLSGPRDLANHAINSDDARRGFVRHLFHFAVKQPTAVYGPTTLDTMDASFRNSGFNIRQLMMDIALHVAINGMKESG